MTSDMSLSDKELIPDFVFLPCTEDDLPQIIGPSLRLLEDFQKDSPLDLSVLKNALLKETLGQLPDYTKLVHADQILGWYHLIRNESTLEIDDFNIRPEFRSQGIGGKILFRLKKQAMENKLPLIAVVQADNADAIGFYSRHEFVKSEPSDKKYLTFLWTP